jgi:hypothetical protein
LYSSAGWNDRDLNKDFYMYYESAARWWWLILIVAQQCITSYSDTLLFAQNVMYQIFDYSIVASHSG